MAQKKREEKMNRQNTEKEQKAHKKKERERESKRLRDGRNSEQLRTTKSKISVQRQATVDGEQAEQQGDLKHFFAAANTSVHSNQ